MGDDAELYMETGGEPSILCDNEDDFSLYRRRIH